MRPAPAFYHRLQLDLQWLDTLRSALGPAPAHRTVWEAVGAGACLPTGLECFPPALLQVIRSPRVRRPIRNVNYCVYILKRRNRLGQYLYDVLYRRGDQRVVGLRRPHGHPVPETPHGANPYCSSGVVVGL